MMLLDANVVLRYLTRDDPIKAERCKALLQSVDRGETQLTTTESIIAEIVYVLSSKRLYGLSQDRVRSLLTPILNLRGLRLTNRRSYHRALELFAETGIDFEDAMAVAEMERLGIVRIVTYDQHFDQFEGIERIEP